MLLNFNQFDSSTFPEPRPFQEDAHERLREGARRGHRCQVLMSSTGSGKTFCGLRIINEALKKGKRAVFVCDRRNLIEQTSKVADSYGIKNHSIMMANHWRFDPSLPFQIASAQTLARRQWPQADVIVVDECHTQMKSWVDHIQRTDAMVIGLSATPFSKGLGKLFTNLVCASSIHELTESGVLVPLKVFSCTRTNMSGAATVGGEWTDGAAAERGMDIVGDVVLEWHRHAENRKTIVFGATIAHCEELCRQFNESGVMAAVFCADTSDADRKVILAEYSKPDSAIRVLISVEALAKGMDQKDVGCIVDCRPLRKSLSTFIQMIGRALRASPETGKVDALLLDHSGNIVRFADDYADIFYNGLDALDTGEKFDKTIRKDDEEKEEGKACPKCGYKPCGKRCVSCGHEHVSTNLIEHLPGQMEEFKVGKASAGDKLSVWEQAVTLCRNYGKPETADKRAAHLYRSITGVWPRGMPDFDKTKSVMISRAVQNKHRANMIAFSKSKKAA